MGEEERSQGRFTNALSQLGLLFSALDALHQCFAVHDSMGRLQHASQAYLQAVELSGPEGEPVRGQASQQAQVVCAIAVASRLTRVQRLGERTVRTARGEYRLQTAYLGVGVLSAAPAALTTLTPPAADPFSAERLQRGFRLTRAQARVAQYLVQGLRNSEIAARLVLSEHTVRHHIEQIRMKVGGHTRAAVAARLREHV
jgi:DNA-binding CsgD family transcriptional regulator